MKYLLILILLSPAFTSAQKVQPSWDEIRQIQEMVPYPMSITQVGFRNYLDTNVYYLMINKKDDFEHGYICMKYQIDKGYLPNRRFVFCDCTPLDSAYAAIRFKYRTDKKFRDSVDNH